MDVNKVSQSYHLWKLAKCAVKNQLGCIQVYRKLLRSSRVQFELVNYMVSDLCIETRIIANTDLAYSEVSDSNTDSTESLLEQP